MSEQQDQTFNPTSEQTMMDFDATNQDLLMMQLNDLTFEQIEPLFNFLPKMMSVVQELPKSENGESVTLLVKDLYDSLKNAEDFLNSLGGADKTQEQQAKIYAENLIKIKEKS